MQHIWRYRGHFVMLLIEPLVQAIWHVFLLESEIEAQADQLIACVYFLLISMPS